MSALKRFPFSLRAPCRPVSEHERLKRPKFVSAAPRSVKLCGIFGHHSHPPPRTVSTGINVQRCPFCAHRGLAFITLRIIPKNPSETIKTHTRLKIDWFFAKWVQKFQLSDNKTSITTRATFKLRIWWFCEIFEEMQHDIYICLATLIIVCDYNINQKVFNILLKTFYVYDRYLDT